MNWHPHHEHYLLHAGYHLLAVALASACWLGTVGLWYASQADTVTSSGTVNLSAQVGDIIPGPTVVSGGSYGLPPPAAPPPPPPATPPPSELPKVPDTDPFSPYLTAVGETTEITHTPDNDVVYIFSTPRPTFAGTTNIPGALLIFNVQGPSNFIFTKEIGSQTSWRWISPITLNSGSYSINIQAYSLTAPEIRASTTLLLRIKPFDLLTPPDTGIHPPTAPTEEKVVILLTIDPKSKNIQPGEPVALKVNLLSPLRGKDISLPFTFDIIDQNGQNIAQTSEIVTIPTGGHFTKLLFTAPNIKHGNYQIIARASMRDYEAISEDSFLISGRPKLFLSAGFIDLSVVYLSLILLGLMFALIAYLEHRQIIRLNETTGEISDSNLKTSSLIE